MSDRIGLDIAVVVFASPDELSAGFERVSNHVIDESMFVPDSFFLESGLELGFVNFRENVLSNIIHSLFFLRNLESAIVFFENGVFGGKIKWPFSAGGEDHAASSEIADRLVGIVHSHCNAAIFVFVDCLFLKIRKN